ncbi:MAG TPA: ATP-binding cassette domain-containing protein [Candidatus Saccharimonadales bacterium]|nr:ATP-binding cassette domain-containing protein [Candidatus Saccharimonadales bacterium]
MKGPIIKAEDVVKTFGEIRAVDGISFEVYPGEIFAFLGPNGAGKSTTISMLTTMLRPTSGKLMMNGHDVTREQANARKSFGIVFQDPALEEELSAYENMVVHAVLYSVPKKEQTPRIEELLKLVDLWERRDSMVKTYSGGMRRRLEIARGLLHHPKILFLDEPTLGLDTQTRNLLWDYVQKLSKHEGMTIFFTTHYLDEAEAVAERIAIIDHGKIVATGTSAELAKQTKTKSLEEAYLELTGRTVRDETSLKNDGLNVRGALQRQRLR